jgi:hypothetical protein
MWLGWGFLLDRRTIQMSKMKQLHAKALKVVQNVAKDFTPEVVDVQSPSGTAGPSLVKVLDLVAEWKLSVCQFHAMEHILKGDREALIRAMWFCEREIQRLDEESGK